MRLFDASVVWRFAARAVLAGMFGLAAASWADSPTLEVIPLRYRTADQLIPVIQPMLARGGTVSGFQGQLIVRTTRANLDEIRRILASIDTPPRRLLITVRQDAEAVTGERGVEVAGRAGNSRPGRDQTVELRARALDTRTVENDRNTQVVQALEGAVAFLHVGQSIPVYPRAVVGGYSGGRVIERYADGVEYREVGTGFYAVPRVVGDRVTLELSPHRDALSGQHQGRIDVQRAATTVAGRLGEWIEVAGIARDTGGEQSLLLGSTSYRSGDTRRVLVKVEELN